MSKYTKKYSKEFLMELVNSGKKQKQISEILQINNRRVYDMFKFYNIETGNKGYSLIKDEKFFDIIDSEIKAYLLGFLIADGCICVEPKKKNGKIYSYNKRISFCNSISDISTIQLYIKYICPSNTIKYYHNKKGAKNRKLQAMLKWSSCHMVDKLISYNINPRKTQDVNFKFNFDILPTEDLKIHFLRGFFDGDGCSTIIKSGKYKYPKVGFVGTSLSFMNQIIDIYKKYNLNFKSTKHKGKNMVYYQIWLYGGKKKTYHFRDIMYKNANFYLQRKLNKLIKENTELSSTISKGVETV